MIKIRFFSLSVLCLFAVSCVTKDTAGLQNKALTSYQLAQRVDGALISFFSCVRQHDLTIIAAHRGGPSSEYPENSLESVIRIANQIPAIIEVDIRASKDGVLFLQHDQLLNRGTTGTGNVTHKNWQEISKLHLRDSAGQETEFSPVSLSSLLQWSQDKALLYLDVKPPTSIQSVYALVKQHRALGRVIYIVYNRADARWLAKRDPFSMIALALGDKAQLQELESMNLPFARLHALTNTPVELPDFFADLQQKQVIATFLSGGEKGLDTRIAENGNNLRYQQVADSGINVLFTDRPLAAYRTLYANLEQRASLTRCMAQASSL